MATSVAAYTQLWAGLRRQQETESRRHCFRSSGDMSERKKCNMRAHCPRWTARIEAVLFGMNIQGDPFKAARDSNIIAATSTVGKLVSEYFRCFYAKIIVVMEQEGVRQWSSSLPLVASLIVVIESPSNCTTSRSTAVVLWYR